MPFPCRLARLRATFALLLWLCPFALVGARADDALQWPFRRLQCPKIPSVARGGWVKNPIDAFILAKLEQHGLQPSPRADKLQLLRRVTYDLTGLAPTEAEREAFLHDNRPEAYERVVDRLLASPRFGERWAQHWLDVVRFAETEGFKLDRFRPDAYRYRDYVIRAFNSDLPYDRFVQQQLAGDELEPGNVDAIVATGFLRLHPEESNGADYRQIRQDILDDITDVVGTTFMGLTVGCARCHDHKFDPIGQDDYYELQAFFTPLLPRDDTPLFRPGERQTYDRMMQGWMQATEDVRKQIDTMLQPVGAQVFKDAVSALDPETQTALKTAPARRTPYQQQLATLGGKQVERRFQRMYRRLGPEQRVRYEDLQKRLTRFDRLKPRSPMAMAVCDVGPKAPPTRRLAGGDYRRPKEEVQPGFPDALDTRQPDIHPPDAVSNSTGRRTALARWLTEPDHPLTSRVIVNRVWGEYFGHGIVGTPSDFGKMGQPATHPELLDYLAAELVRQRWSLKAIHRLIVTSASYKQASHPEDNPTEPAAKRLDPDDKLLWHARVRRRDAESIRDVALQASGRLNPRMFGPSAKPELPDAMSEDRYAWEPDAQPTERDRRSIYVFHRRNLSLPLLQAFDAPDGITSCPSRSTTVTTPQALLLLNGEFSMTQSRRLAGRLLATSMDGERIIRLAYRQILGREPDSEELSRCRQFLDEQSARVARGPAPAANTLPEVLPPGVPAAAGAAVVDLCHALLNCAEFLYVE